MSMKKIALYGGGAVAVIVVAVVLVVVLGLDDIVKAIVEKSGSDVTQVEVTLDEADVDILEGTAALSGLIVDNPPGFESDNAFTLGNITAKVDTSTIGKDALVINEIVVNRPEVTYEFGENGSNFDALQRNVASHGGGGSSDSSDSEGPKVIIDHLYIRDGQVNVTAVPLGGKTMGVSLPEIHLTDIGRDSEGGADPAEIAEVIMAAVTSEISGFVSGLDLSSVVEGIETLPAELEKFAGEAVTESVDAVAEEADAVTEGVGDAVGGIGDAVDDLLGE